MSHALTTMSSLGSKIKQGVEFLGAVKSAIDTGRMKYNAIQPLAGVRLVAA